MLIALAALVLPACEPAGNATEAAGQSGLEQIGSDLEPAGASAVTDVRVVLLGTGTPIPQPGRSGPATAIVAWDRAYLVDIGRGALLQARIASLDGIEALDPRQLRVAFLTHLHSDHITGLPDLIATPPTLGREGPLSVYGPPGTRAMTERFVAAFVEDFAQRSSLRERAPATIVMASEISVGPVYEDSYVRVTAFAVEHPGWEHAYGYRFDTSERSIVVSGDTAPARAVIDACRGCDVLVHEVYCAVGMKRMTSSQNLWDYNARAHTSARELGEIAAQARPKLLVLTHRIDYGCSREELVALVGERFDGKVVVGDDLAVY